LDDEEDDWFHSSWAWSQDGRLLVSYSGRGLYVLNDVLGSKPELVQSFVGNTPIYLSVSQDNTRIAFVLYPDRQLFVMNMDGSNLRQLTKSDKTYIDGLTWSPVSLNRLIDVVPRQFHHIM
jgi:Tol biopolymer transport system component